MRIMSHPCDMLNAREKTMGEELKIDTVGYWSEMKIEIIKKYAWAYSTILAKQSKLKHIYVDGFAGAGKHISRTTGEEISGSPINVLEVEPAFTEYHFIDIESMRVNALMEAARDNPNVYIYHGDCNSVLMDEIFPVLRRDRWKRAFVVLDPYGLDLDWLVIQEAGRLETVDLILHFPVMDMNRNAFWRDPDRVPEWGIKRMNRFWGDESWREAAYSTEQSLFGFAERTDNDTVANAFAKRLEEKAGFKFTAKPLPLRNERNAVIYYLHFASPKEVARKIAADIFKKYRGRL